MTNVESLPDEVLEFILSLVSPYGELKACALTCHRWNICSKNVVKKRQSDFIRSVQEMDMDWSACTNATTTVTNEIQHRLHESGNHEQPVERCKALTVGKRYSHSAVYDDSTDSMYIFGGCTSTATTFNDLWRLDLTTRRWHRPIATGTYPSPKACSVLVKYKKKLILFGGWTHPSMYPLHRWRLFNELHSYDIENSTWTQLLTPAPGARENVEDDTLRPPTMAGHSATIHRNKLVVFGGLQKQRNSIGQFSSSSDVWSFDLERMSWQQEDVPEPRPTPRYGQSQLYLDERHFLILGGCGGPSNIFNDVWLLSMGPAADNVPGDTVHWKWSRCRVENSLHGASHMWCHPAVKVGNFAVILGKNRLPKQQNDRRNQVQENKPRKASTDRLQPLRLPASSQHEQARWNVIPQLRRGVNRGYGAIRRAHPPSVPRTSHNNNIAESINSDNSSMQSMRNEVDLSANSDSYDEPMAISDGENQELSVIPINEFESAQNNREEQDITESRIYRSQVSLNINCDTPGSDAKVDSKLSDNVSHNQNPTEITETNSDIGTSASGGDSSVLDSVTIRMNHPETKPPSNPLPSSNIIVENFKNPASSPSNQKVVLKNDSQSISKNTSNNSNEKYVKQSSSDSNSKAQFIQRPGSPSASRSPKVSAISFNKSATGQLGAGNKNFLFRIRCNNFLTGI